MTFSISEFVNADEWLRENYAKRFHISNAPGAPIPIWDDVITAAYATGFRDAQIQRSLADNEHREQHARRLGIQTVEAPPPSWDEIIMAIEHPTIGQTAGRIKAAMARGFKI